MSYTRFRYTLQNNKLSVEQRQFYEDNGYLLIRDSVDHSILDECKERFRDLCNGKIDKGHMTLMKDVSLAKTGAQGEYLYNKVQDIVWDDIFSKYIMSPQILDYVECFTGPNIVAMHSMLINKPPDSGKKTSAHPLHQDLYYFSFRPVDRIVAAWTAMEKITPENGCLIAIPGTHKGDLLEHDYPNWENGVNKAYHGVIGFDDRPTVELTMEKGDTVFFHPLLIHGSGPNLTQGFRKAISCHYSTSEFKHIEVNGTVQEKIANEILELARKKGLMMSFSEVWQYRMRAVRGRPPSAL